MTEKDWEKADQAGGRFMMALNDYDNTMRRLLVEITKERNNLRTQVEAALALLRDLETTLAAAAYSEEGLAPEEALALVQRIAAELGGEQKEQDNAAAIESGVLASETAMMHDPLPGGYLQDAEKNSG